MNVMDCMKMRHSYRGEFVDACVPREDLRKIMEAGILAPSGCNVQTTSMIAVDDPEIVAKIRAAIRQDLMQTAPAFICVLTQRIVSYHGMCFAIQDYSASIENMLLMITELGYSSVWGEGQITENRETTDKLAEILGIPEGYEVVCLLPIGKPKDEVHGPGRKPFNERAWFNRFGA